jgi:DNA gyrase subunit A
VLLESSGAVSQDAVPLEVADEPCVVMLSSTGLLARSSEAGAPGAGERAQHDLVVSAVHARVRGQVGLLTSTGRMVRLDVLELPMLPSTNGAPVLAGGVPLTAITDLLAGETVVALASLSGDGPGLALGTAAGVVKRVAPDVPATQDSWTVVRLDADDSVVGAGELVTGSEDLVFITADAQLLRFNASDVRPQGRAGGGVAGIRLATGARAIFFGAVDPDRDAVVVTAASSSGALPGVSGSAVKVTPYRSYPAKGRATGGVRCQRFLKGEDELVLAWAGPGPARAATPSGAPAPLPPVDERRDGSGLPTSKPVAAVAGPVVPGGVAPTTVSPDEPTP